MKKLISLIVLGITCSGFSCNENPVQPPSVTGAIEIRKNIDVSGSTEMDILWVIDNSGSMCQEQDTLAKNFELFIEEIEKTNLDFHIGVTTTHPIGVNAEGKPQAPEPVAIHGHLQSTPQPIPSQVDRSCTHTVTASGEILEDEYLPVLQSLERAVACMTTPDPSYTSPSVADIRCALREGSGKCEIVGRCSGEVGDICSIRSLFPPSSSYRKLPLVLKASDYQKNNKLDVDRLKADFSCMSFVGTLGWGVEQGLSAVLEATKIELTGGVVGEEQEKGFDASAPNHGFIRKHARFATIFVTDENDCTNDGNLNLDTTCGVAACEYANSLDAEDSPLIKVEDIRDQLMENLRVSKGREDFGAGEMLMASIHGDPRRFESKNEPDVCEPGTLNGIKHVCANQRGVAFSGDRYQRFLESFPVGQYFPRADDAVKGWLCTEDFSPVLGIIGKFIGNVGGGCINDPIYPCLNDEECPRFPYSDEPGRCVDRPNSGEKYCDSGIQVRVEVNSITEESMAGLEGSQYCLEGSLGDPEYPKGCVVNPSKYAFVACPDGLPGVKIEWTDETEVKNSLAGTQLEIRYNSQSSDSPGR